MYKGLLQFTKWYLQVEWDEAILLDCLCNFASVYADFDALRKNHRKKAQNALMSIQAVVIFSVYKFMFVWIRCSWRIVCVRRYSTLQVETHHSAKLLWLLKPEYSKFQAAMSVASERCGTCCSLCHAHLVSNTLCKHVCSVVISLQFQCPLLDSLCDEVNLVIGGFYFFVNAGSVEVMYVEEIIFTSRVENGIRMFFHVIVSVVWPILDYV